MAYLFYYLILKPLSWLPLRVTYFISDGLFVLLYRVIGYRKKVVADNIRGSFPDWGEAQVLATTADFYRHFCDMLVESIRMFSISETEVLRRCRVTNPEVLAAAAAKQQSIILLGSHYANWEVAALAFPKHLAPHITVGVYSPLKNEVMDNLVKNNRARYGTRLVSRRDVKAYYADPPPGLAADFFIGDQSPSNAAWQKVHWTHFLNRITSFVTGAERYAVRYNRPVFYMRLRRIKRGYQEATIVPVTNTPRAVEPGYITEFLARELEREIQLTPAHWLWTHRRWKRGVPDEVPPLLAKQPFLAGDYERDPDAPSSRSETSTAP